jgi:selenocysteine lyase/cysteine desulfurase
VLKWLNFDFPIENKAEIVNTFKNAFSEKTKVVHITHMINWMGQVLPAREIADAAKKRGIEVLVDAAHSFVHIDFKISDLNCDYFGTSLHKWLCAPFGSGMLYVQKDKIKNLYPLFAGNDPESDNIRKFESLGTRSFAIEQAIGQAINFHHMIGMERKTKRLHYLKNYWAERVMEMPGVDVRTSLKPEWACAIALLHVDGKTPGEVTNYLFKKHKIHTVGINWENIHGVRITPNVYTTTRDLDRLVHAVHEISKKG